MNNYYTLLSLVREIIYEIRGKKIIEVWSQKKDQIDIFFDPAESGKLTFSASSPETAIFHDRRAAKPSRNAASFFSEIYGYCVSGLELVSPSDRFVRMTFTGQAEELLFLPFGSRPNVFLVRDGHITSAFKDPARQIGRPAPEPKYPERDPTASLHLQPSQNDQSFKNPTNAGEHFSREDMTQVGGDSSEFNLLPDANLSLREKIISIDPQFPRKLINDVADTCELDLLNVSDLLKKILELRYQLLHPEKAIETAEGHLCLLSPEYLSHPPRQIFNSVNEAVRTLFLTRNREQRLLPRKRDLEKRLLKKRNNWEKQLQQFEKKEERLEKANHFEHLGHLLMSHHAAGSIVDSEVIKMADWDQEGTEIEIPVKSGITLVEQAQKYYDRASGIRKEVALSDKKKRELIERIGISGRLLEESGGIENLSDLEKWLKQNESQLRQLGYTSSDKKPEARPYRLIPLGDYEVWIGKNATSNDEMLKLSHKEDIWMHVRGASGSHLIIRNMGQADWPEKMLLLRAASWAAAWSRQAGSSLVPVMMAKRKHVRKPKGALPGQVTVSNERVEMVKPHKPDIADS